MKLLKMWAVIAFVAILSGCGDGKPAARRNTEDNKEAYEDQDVRMTRVVTPRRFPNYTMVKDKATGRRIIYLEGRGGVLLPDKEGGE
jgi:hypothetical protein